jgi:hypothetical protein
MKRLVATLLLVGPLLACAQKTKNFSLVEDKKKKEIRVMYKGRLLTAYCYYDSSRKPMLFPVNTVDGITVTRSYPFKMVAGERTDHPHHTGLWLNYESVNGLDFWNNSTAIPVERRERYGTIVHKNIFASNLVNNPADSNVTTLQTQSEWIRPNKVKVLTEFARHDFRVEGNIFTIDRVTTLTAADSPVVFKDVKDGMYAIRVARELELPSKEKSKFVDDKGNVTEVAPSGNDVSGMYYGSNGSKGDSAWGTKGEWMMLTGKKDGRDITIAMFDHPSNTGYPTYWHARGYGLFALNPLGRKVFSNGKEELNLTLKPGEQITFRYRVAIVSGKLTAEDMSRMAAEFAKTK